MNVIDNQTSVNRLKYGSSNSHFLSVGLTDNVSLPHTEP